MTVARLAEDVNSRLDAAWLAIESLCQPLTWIIEGRDTLVGGLKYEVHDRRKVPAPVRKDVSYWRRLALVLYCVRAAFNNFSGQEFIKRRPSLAHRLFHGRVSICLKKLKVAVVSLESESGGMSAAAGGKRRKRGEGGASSAGGRDAAAHIHLVSDIVTQIWGNGLTMKSLRNDETESDSE